MSVFPRATVFRDSEGNLLVFTWSYPYAVDHPFLYRPAGDDTEFYQCKVQVLRGGTAEDHRLYLALPKKAGIGTLVVRRHVNESQGDHLVVENRRRGTKATFRPLRGGFHDEIVNELRSAWVIDYLCQDPTDDLYVLCATPRYLQRLEPRLFVGEGPDLYPVLSQQGTRLPNGAVYVDSSEGRFEALAPFRQLLDDPSRPPRWQGQILQVLDPAFYRVGVWGAGQRARVELRNPVQ